MRFRGLSLLFCGLFTMTSCERRTPVLTEEQIARFTAEAPGMTAECIDKMRYGGIEAIPNQVDECYEMEPQRRFDGLWRNQLESVIFCPAPETTCDWSPSKAWVTFADGVEPTGVSYPGLFRISFLGRKTLKPGINGHFGMSKHEIVIDRILRLKEVPDPIAGSAGGF